jgi:uncharacterized membrane protein YdcZ (DUF606 family)
MRRRGITLIEILAALLGLMTASYLCAHYGGFRYPQAAFLAGLAGGLVTLLIAAGVMKVYRLGVMRHQKMRGNKG